MNDPRDNTGLAPVGIGEAKTVVPSRPSLKPLVKWSGGKRDEIKQFSQYIPQDIDTYIEPFVGGGALFFHLNPKKAVISDVHTELMDFYKSIKEGHKEEIYSFMLKHENEEETYYKVRDDFQSCSLDEQAVGNETLQNAVRFYYLRKTCFRGMLRYNKQGKFNIPFGRYKTYRFEDIKNKKYEDLLKTTEVRCENFESIFEEYNDQKNFMFLDPPYDSEFTDYGYCKFDKTDHTRLAEFFKSTKIRCLMVIGKTPFIETLYQGYIVEEYEKKYRFKIHSGRVGNEINTKHLIIMNLKLASRP